MQYFKTGSHKSEYFKSLIFKVDYVLTHNENEALLLEINLIKTHKPKFNIIFKDDKTYPFICVLENDGNTKVEARRSKQSRLKKLLWSISGRDQTFSNDKGHFRVV